jgi:hypothetical protein
MKEYHLFSKSMYNNKAQIKKAFELRIKHWDCYISFEDAMRSINLLNLNPEKYMMAECMVEKNDVIVERIYWNLKKYMVLL